MAHYFLHAVGRDRPGIVARVARALADLGCNLEDSRMTLLRGEFAVMLVLDAPEGTDAGAIEGQLAAVAEELDLAVAVRALDLEGEQSSERTGLPPAGSLSTALSVSVHGADRPGIVAGIAEQLSGVGANVVDLATHVLGREEPVYVMVLDVVLPEAERDLLEERLARAAESLGVRCVVSAGDAELF